MSLRATLKDAATSLAKGHAHPSVEERHVWLAVARHFRKLPTVEPLLNRAKEALGAKGASYGVPVVSKEADALLALLANEEKALQALQSRFGEPSGDGDADTKVVDVVGSVAAGPAAVSEGREPAVPPTQPPAPKQESVGDVLAELDALVGLAPVKERVRQLIAVVETNEQRRRAGLARVSPSMHLVFTGPPGTGKTTVARLIARLFAAAGALPGRNFVESSRADLIAGYVGQTALKVADVVRRATPGVLFIDEAYALAGEGKLDYGAEAIATLVKTMEDHRDRLAVIVAGYDEEMETFIGSNPGLKSRFTNYVRFPDYAPEELTSIFEGMATAAEVHLGEGVRERVHDVFLRAVRGDDFGNARFARTLFENAFAHMARRAAMDGRIELTEVTHLLPEDIVWDGELPNGREKRIGF